ncbi:MAG: hypothetical protein ABIJ37_07250 [Pseudomonadota bacterium]
MTWEHDDTETAWIWPPVIKFNDTEILWSADDTGISIFEIEKCDLKDGKNGAWFNPHNI